MLLNLYGDDGLMFRLLATGFKEAHLENRVKFQVVEVDKAGAKFKNAVKEKYNAKYLDDADMVIRFALVKDAPVQQDDGNAEQPADDEKTQAPENNAEGENVSEAETTATGADLKKRVVDTVARCLYQEDKNKVDISDLDEYLDGYDVCFVKISFKEKEQAGEAG